LGVLIELNVGAIREVGSELAQNHLMRAYAIAKNEGCQFTFGTDSHSIKGLEGISFANEIANYLRLRSSDIAEFVRDGVIE
jgi:histidinol phosphatase-like PHP family hydrolase